MGIVLVMRAPSYCLQRLHVRSSLGALEGSAKVVAVVPAGVLAATQQQRQACNAAAHHAQVIRGRNNVERSADGSWNFAAGKHDDLADGGVHRVVDGVKANAGVVFKSAEGEGVT